MPDELLQWGQWVRVLKLASFEYKDNVRVLVRKGPPELMYGRVTGVAYCSEGRYQPGGAEDAPYLEPTVTHRLYRVVTSWRSMPVLAMAEDLATLEEPRKLPFQAISAWSEADRAWQRADAKNFKRDKRGRFV